jgi:DNA-binding response OmpR family regulator
MGNQALRILLADQNLTSAKRLSTYLQESGFEVHLLHDGILAEEHILEFKPHFILIDLTLPNFTAFQCLEFLKKEGLLENDKTRVFVLSQHNAKQNVEACLGMGAHDYLVKPVNPIDVLTRLALHLQAKSRTLKETVDKDKASQQLNYSWSFLQKH